MQAHSVGLTKQRFAINKFCIRFFPSSPCVYKNLHAKGSAKSSHRLSNRTVAHQPQREPVQFHERFFPVTKIGASTPVAISNTGVVQGRLRGQLEQQCKGHLRHRLGAVAGDIGHRNIAGGRCAGVHDIITGGEHTDIAQLGQCLDDLGGYE